jgi:hypothetical protein
MVYFQTKNPKMGKFSRDLQDVAIFYGYYIYLSIIWYILWPIGKFNGYLEYFVLFWYVLQIKILHLFYQLLSLSFVN